jgi:hypothetical protein
MKSMFNLTDEECATLEKLLIKAMTPKEEKEELIPCPSATTCSRVSPKRLNSAIS